MISLEDLPAVSRERIEHALDLARRDVALRDLADMLSRDRPSLWKTADEIARRLDRFESTAWPRIQAGARQPRDSVEKALSRVLACHEGPRSHRRIFELLRDVLRQ